MLIPLCFFPNCKNHIVAECNCRSNLNICDLHISQHLSSTGDHSITEYLVKIPDNLKEKLSRQLQNLKKLIKQKIQYLTSYANASINLIVSETSKIHQKLLIQSHLVNSLIVSLNQDLTTYKSFINDVALNNKLNFEIPSFRCKDLSRCLKKIQAFESLETYKNDEYTLIFDYRSSNKIDTIKLKNLKQSSISFEVNDLSSYCGCCKLDEDKFFICGGYFGEVGRISDNVRIIDVKKGLVEEMPASNPVAHVGLCLADEEVYRFGGFTNTRNSSECKKFLIKDRVWKDIQSLPEANCDTSAGYQSHCLYFYNIEKNSFAISNYTFSSDSFKFIFENWILCFQDYLYKIDENGYLIQKQKIYFPLVQLNSSACFRRKEFIYFVTYGPVLYRIDIKLGTIQPLDILKIG